MNNILTLYRRSRPRSTASTILVLVVLLCIVHPPVINAQIEPLVARIKAAVVLVEVRDVLGGKARGSGFIYDPSGFVLTNHHVIEGATDIKVTLPDGRAFTATVVDYMRRLEFTGSELNTTTDAAVLKINATSLPTMLIGNSDALRQGQELLVLGYPGGVGTGDVSVTRGIVSALRSGWIQTDAVIEHGNSGGPVIDRDGRVIGLATFVTGPSRKIGGVVAINTIRALAESASLPSGQRYQEMKITGMEYVSPALLPHRKTFRISYDPGKTSAQAYVREYTSERTQMQNINGAIVYSVHDSRGSEAKNYFGADGVLNFGYWEPNWTYSFSEPLLVFPLPPIVGQSWHQQTNAENSSNGARFRSTGDLRLEQDNEVVSVPAGTFSRVLKVTSVAESISIRGAQTFITKRLANYWYAPGLALIRAVIDISPTGEHSLTELVSY